MKTMLVKLRTVGGTGGMGIGYYNTSVPIEFDCALCGVELEKDDKEKTVTHPKTESCTQAGLSASAVFALPLTSPAPPATRQQHDSSAKPPPKSPGQPHS